MNDPIRLAVNGATGRMGARVCDLATQDTRFDLVARCGSATDWGALPTFDVLVDFSSPEGLSHALDYCAAHGIALVSGTTGLDAALVRHMDSAAMRIPLLHAANFSLGIAVLTRLLREAAAALPTWDLDIGEVHHAAKRDAPSGTALALGRAAAAARRVDFDAVAAINRDGVRKPGSIGFASMRVGDVVGEHSAWLAAPGERLELGHRATDRVIFVRGALQAAAWVAGRAPGHYTLQDMIGA